MLLDNGVLCEDGIPQDVVSSYTSRIASQSVTDIAERTDRRGNGRIRFTDVWLEDKRGTRIQCILTGQDVRFVLAYQCNGDSLPREVVFSITVLSPLGQSLLLLRSDYTGDRFEHIPPRGQVICDVPHFPLMPGEYHLSLYAEKQEEILDWVSFAFDLKVVEGDYFGTGRLPPKTHSPFLVNHFWTMRND
jgi:lipopolysaccharide transport system ATP-binding protein